MRIHDISIFTEDGLIPEFNQCVDNAPVLNISSNSVYSPRVSIFFDNEQDAVNFKNGVGQAWETYLREEKKMGVKLENIVKMDLLENGKKYIRDGYLIFDTITLEIVTDGIIVRFYNKSEKLAQIKHQSLDPLNMKFFELHLIEGSIEINIE